MVIAASLLLHPSARYFPWISSSSLLSRHSRCLFATASRPFFAMPAVLCCAFEFLMCAQQVPNSFRKKNIKIWTECDHGRTLLPFSNMMFIESNSNYLLLFVLTQQVFLRCTQIRPATTDWLLFATRVASTRENRSLNSDDFFFFFFLNNFFLCIRNDNNGNNTNNNKWWRRYTLYRYTVAVLTDIFCLIF